MTSEDKQQYFNYLNVLRESGVTNMFGAPMYLVDEFEISRNEAKQITAEWMNSFSTQAE